MYTTTNFKTKRALKVAVAALEVAVSRITDDHGCLDCGSADHDEDCIVPVMENAIAVAAEVGN